MRALTAAVIGCAGALLAIATHVVGLTPWIPALWIAFAVVCVVLAVAWMDDK